MSINVKKNRWLLNYFFIKCHLNLNLIEFLSDDVIKIKFVNLWDLSGHSERLNNVQEAYLPITSISWQIVSEIVAIITNPSRFHSVLNELSQI